MALHILQPGLSTQVMDRGRPGHRAWGVPVGGAADRGSLALGNALVGNAPGLAALEISLAGPTLRSDTPVACVLYGAPFTLRADQHPAGLRAGTTFTLRPGETLTVGGTSRRMRAYLCVRGGFHEPALLDSRSALTPVCAGQLLACDASVIRPRFLPPLIEEEEARVVLHAIAGPQEDWFDADRFYAGDYEVTPASNRMGLRLHGEALRPPAREMISEPVAPGAVQVTRDGQCIVLGVDGQTIGGYPKVAHVITADLDRLGQLRPGERVRFERVTLETAAARQRARQETIDAWVARLRTTDAGG
jgi:biotin-dependent carboxylase-like uncharacterized protein